jgi:hypothetical protein
MGLLMNLVQMFANYNKKSEHTNLQISTAQLIEVSDRYSSVFKSTTRLHLGEDTTTPVFEGFANLNGVKINTHKIIASTEQFSEDILNLIQEDSIDMVLFPWQLGADHETHDSSFHMLPEVLKIKALSVGILIKTGDSEVINLSEAKLMVPFFGGPDDRKATELALSFGVLTCIVYYKTEIELDDEDKKLIDILSHFAEKDPSISYSVKDFSDSEENIISSLKEDLESNQFSLISVGFDNEYLSRNSSEPSDLEPLVGKLAGKLIDTDFPTPILVVKSGGNCNFLTLSKSK